MRGLAGCLVVLVLAYGTDALRLPQLLRGGSGKANNPEGTQNPVSNDRPLIGILSQTAGPSPFNNTYIAASYIKYVEAGGARAVPIQCDLPPVEIARRFGIVNGLLIPGGAQPLQPGECFYDAALQLLNLATAATDAGDYFPVHATCLGLETLAIIMSGDLGILSAYDAGSLPSVMQLTTYAKNGLSRVWNGLPAAVKADLVSKNYSMENHAWGVSVESFRYSPGLVDNFNLVATSFDRGGLEYVALFEGKKWPIYGIQSHPEKPAFEWAPWLPIPHQAGAVDATLALARFFVDETRRSAHRPSSRQEEEELLIYNWMPNYTGRFQPSGKGESSFEQSYFFPALHSAEATRVPEQPWRL
mmetsp:Transcript_4011/g.11645  ORF Transcript_4011/g.11645 Transcript_4011/m.11645 type:complete len:359 (-) Transcript_4011:301-1377(-)